MVAALVALYFVGQYGRFDRPEETGRLADLGRATGSLLPNMIFLTPHPNAVAAFLEGVRLLSLVLTRHARGGERVLWCQAAAVIAYGLLISGSRGAWVELVVAIGIWAQLLITNRILRLALRTITVAGV